MTCCTKTVDNLTLEDIVAAIPVGQMADGTVSLPGLSFTLDTDTGLYRPSDNNIGFATNGVIRFFIGATNNRSYLPFYLEDGTAVAPALAFASESTIGLFRPASGQIGVTGALILDTFTGNNDGSYSGAMSLASVDDPDSGFNWITGGGGEIEVVSQNNRVFEFQAAQVNALVRTEIEYQSGNPQLVLDRSGGGETFVLFNDSGNDAHIQNLSGAAVLYLEHTSGGSIAVQPSANTITNVDFRVNVGDGVSAYDNVFIVDENSVFAQDGAVGAPGYAFINHTDTGIYANASTLFFSESGNSVLQISTGLDTFVLGVSNVLGPTDLQITNQLGENILYDGANQTLTIQTNDINRLQASNSGVEFNTLDGTATDAGIFFSKAQNTGLSNVNTPIESFTSRTLPSGNQTDWKDLIYADGYFVACGTGNGADSYEYIMRSTDGVTWATASSIDALASSNMDCRGITYSSSLDRFVVVGNGTADVIYSDDSGDNWSVSNNGLTQANDWEAIDWNGSLFVAVSSNGTNRVATSTDGITWTLRSASNANTWNSVKWFSTASLWVACNDSGSTTLSIMTSPDGITWTDRTIPSGVALNALAVNEDLGEIVAFGFNAAFSSTNGTSWASITFPTLAVSPIRALWNGNCYWVHGLNGVYTYSDETGRNFVTAKNMPAAHDFYGIAFAPSLNLFAHVSTDTETVYTNEEQQSVKILSDATEILDVNNVNIQASVPTVHPYATAAGTDSGVTIPDGTVVFELTAGTETGAYALTGPSGIAGQILYVRNDSGQATTGLVTAASAGATFANNGTSWLLIG